MTLNNKYYKICASFAYCKQQTLLREKVILHKECSWTKNWLRGERHLLPNLTAWVWSLAPVVEENIPVSGNKNLGPETLRLPEENTGTTLQNIGAG